MSNDFLARVENMRTNGYSDIDIAILLEEFNGLREESAECNSGYNDVLVAYSMLYTDMAELIASRENSSNTPWVLANSGVSQSVAQDIVESAEISHAVEMIFANAIADGEYDDEEVTNLVMLSSAMVAVHENFQSENLSETLMGQEFERAYNITMRSFIDFYNPNLLDRIEDGMDNPLLLYHATNVEGHLLDETYQIRAWKRDVDFAYDTFSTGGLTVMSAALLDVICYFEATVFATIAEDGVISVAGIWGLVGLFALIVGIGLGSFTSGGVDYLYLQVNRPEAPEYYTEQN